MERICEQRVADGLPGLAIQWGAIGDVGVVSDSTAADTVIGISAPQRIRSCMSVMDKFLSQRHPVVSSFVRADHPRKSSGENKHDLLHSVARILGVTDMSRLNPSIRTDELGADSLMTVELKQTLERDYDLNLSMREIRQLTIARIRDISEGGRGASSAHEKTGMADESKGGDEPEVVRFVLSARLVPDHTLVEMNDVEDKHTRVFFLHPIEGHIDALRELASELPVRAVGVQWTSDIPTHSIEDMAAAYLQKILTLQPEGPYHLSGYSFGTAIAFEMALQLQAVGASVGSLTLLDGTPMHMGSRVERRYRFGRSKRMQETELLCSFLMRYLDEDVIELRTQLDQYQKWDDKLGSRHRHPLERRLQRATYSPRRGHGHTHLLRLLASRIALRTES
ncbi:hypothetical protein MTO96_032290 [Rhipicephalus appendiculatus]